MKQSNEEQVNRIIELIETAIRLLLNRDLTMLQNDEEDNNNAIPENLRVLDRALHEVSINHRLANYIEENLNEVEGKDTMWTLNTIGITIILKFCKPQMAL
jgi:hypothetical protein